ncbi:DUF397 domain-containing protein [Sphaerisporangium sp. NPDC005288]|uniref:DUF397 domain-containing protein n=1 Tax=Sphaerisporangium sp. NPDC005288 TaxID=3155114 RepID=UPI0033B742C2
MQQLRDAEWRKSSHSAAQGECVEVAIDHLRLRGLRDSKNTAVPAIVVTPVEWDAFLAGVKNGEV